ncbi:GAF domain-containing protein [soil metagenome]
MANPRPAAILSRLLSEDHSLASLAVRLCSACVDQLAITGAGLGLMSGGTPSGPTAATDGLAALLEELQFTLGEGPCVDATHEGRPVLYPDMAARSASSRWPSFAAAALSAGVAAVFAFPLQVGAVRIGVLDLYRDTAGPLGATDLADALDFAEAATMLLLYLQDRSDSDDPKLLCAAFDDRAEVHQATGMLAVQIGVTLGEALLRLRAAAYAQGHPLSELAADVLAGRLHIPPDPSTAGDSR